MKVDIVFPLPLCEKCNVAELKIESVSATNYFGDILMRESRVVCKHKSACTYVYNECCKKKKGE
jgi:hypothetical protein